MTTADDNGNADDNTNEDDDANADTGQTFVRQQSISTVVGEQHSITGAEGFSLPPLGLLVELFVLMLNKDIS